MVSVYKKILLSNNKWLNFEIKGIGVFLLKMWHSQ
jgi:hypothetical protein